MPTWITSDTHFGHKLMASMRGFSSIEDMDEALIENHNALVKPNDIVYNLGDFSFHKADKTKEIVKRLNGQKFLIYGNHDRIIRKSKEIQDLFIKCDNYKEIKINETALVLCHFPMIVWNKSHYGSIMVHGHCHGSMRYPFEGRIYDAGVDCNFLRPISAESIVEMFASFSPHVIDHHTSTTG